MARECLNASALLRELSQKTEKEYIMKVKKVTKPQLDAIRIIKDCGGAVLTSHWTYGNGRYITKRPVPPHCEHAKANSEHVQDAPKV